MNCIYLNKVQNFVDESSKHILSVFKENFIHLYGNGADVEQVKAWEASIRFLQQALNDEKIHNLSLAFEYRLPFSNERIDLLIFGEDKSQCPKVILFELKGWKQAYETEQQFMVNADNGLTIHPVYQIKNYVGKIKFSHSKAEDFQIIPAILMYNSTSETIKLNFSGVDVFFRNDMNRMINFLAENLTSQMDDELIKDFLNGEYKQSKKLFDAIKEHYREIKEQSYLTLAENGWGLSQEQLELIQEVIKDLVNSRDNIVYLIQGAPGSGKTLVAIHLLLAGLQNNYQTLLAYRNNRLINSIRNIFDTIEPGLSNPIKFYSVGPRANFTGVAEKNFRGEMMDIIIFDEAQRMTDENIHYALKRAKVTVFFFDEGQILNVEEKGYAENFKSIAEKQNKTIKERTLRGFYRVAGGKQYHDFIENLLLDPANVTNNISVQWKCTYEFKVFSCFEEFFSSLKVKAEGNFKVALIAAFTESPGDLKKLNSERNLRIGYPLISGCQIYKNLNKKIYWLMDPQNDYVPFWVKGESNKLEKCASIYGCQGFETDFAGVIWGRDFVFRNGNWGLGENCEDNIGKPSLKELINKAIKGDEEKYNMAMRLLINRYRVFLTRGIKGTYVFCEDEETADFLLRIYNAFINR